MPRDPGTVPRGAWRTLAACSGLAALLQIDGTLVTVALPDVGRSLHTAPQPLGWVITVYFLAFALLLLPGGRLVDRFGGRRAALAGLALFAAGALLGALAPSFTVLVASRALQGMGAGLASPAALSGAVSGFPPERRGTALGIWGAASGVANIAGPLLGGLLTTAFGWRAAWWALLPLAAAAAVAVARLVPGRVPDAGAEPAAGVLRRRAVLVAVAAAGLSFLVMIGVFFVIEQYLQESAGYSPLLAAAAPMAIAVCVGAVGPVAGRLIDARGERPVLLGGFAVAGAGLGCYGLTNAPLHGLGALPLAVLLGLGLGPLFAGVSRAGLNAVPQRHHGRVSALISAGRLLGAGLGAALAGVALRDGADAEDVRTALTSGAALCLLAGVPLAGWLRGRPEAETV
ncbi:MFS transporter [Dactylosporangium sp. NPDC000244]|uniref:MFS transporter n=1 Tax=Dactylosporangium sp. NPDC000244 TaxID=3154365 RepID=UPI00333440AB